MDLYGNKVYKIKNIYRYCIISIIFHMAIIVIYVLYSMQSHISMFSIDISQSIGAQVETMGSDYSLQSYDGDYGESIKKESQLINKNSPDQISYDSLNKLNGNRVPLYPLIAKVNKWEGIVLLEIDVSSDGFISNIVVKKSSGYGILDKSALSTIKYWKIPNIQGDEFSFILPVEFKIKNSS